jgi:antitoxin component YwqK of YwqJK toxin-antitoxin module
MFEYQLNNKGSYNGSVKDWHYNGQLAKDFNFIDGLENGSQKMWDLKGKIKANFFTVNGERYGLIGLKKCVSVISK